LILLFIELKNCEEENTFCDLITLLITLLTIVMFLCFVCLCFSGVRFSHRQMAKKKPLIALNVPMGKEE